MCMLPLEVNYDAQDRQTFDMRCVTTCGVSYSVR